MLPITVKETELFDEEKEEFLPLVKETTLHLEHSLISLQKWEAIWKKPFLEKTNKTNEEMLSYVECMTLNSQNVDPLVYKALTPKQLDEIFKYVAEDRTATKVYDSRKSKSQKQSTITAEIIYYDMIALQIPPEYRKWHLSQLLALIQVCNTKNDPDNKMSKSQILKQNAELNAMRRKALNSKG